MLTPPLTDPPVMQTSTFETIRALIGRTCLALDNEDYASFLSHCSPTFTYRITANSPEIDKEMVWLEHDRAGYEALLKMLPRHIRLQGGFARHAILCDIIPGDRGLKRAISQLMVIHTGTSGESTLLLSGRYVDDIAFPIDEAPLIQSREVRLDTRLLGPGIHTPI